MDELWGTLVALSRFELGMVITYSLIILFGAVGNLWVIWKCGLVLILGKKQAKITKGLIVCILTICLTDILVLTALSLLVDMKLTGVWRFGEVMCRFYYTAEVLNKFVIPLCLVNISRFSFKSVNISTGRKSSYFLPIANFVAVAVVLALVSYVVLFSKTLHIEIPIKNNTHVSRTMCLFIPPSGHEQIFNGLAFLVGYVVTTVAYIYFYASVPLMLIRKISRATAPGSTSKQLNDSNILKIKYIVTSFVLIYLICWTPYWAFFWYSSLVAEGPRWVIILGLLVHTFPYLSCIAYPVVLTAMNRTIRSEHASILSLHRKRFSTIRNGVMQTLSAHLGMFSMWQRNEGHVVRSTLLRQSDESAV
ncbi:unnamed protein product, partial [Mesorhabditis spiculigera]